MNRDGFYAVIAIFILILALGNYYGDVVWNIMKLLIGLWILAKIIGLVNSFRQ